MELDAVYIRVDRRDILSDLEFTKGNGKRGWGMAINGQ
jgi:hypothetical protein